MSAVGDDPSRVVAVEIASTKTVNILKNIIKDKRRQVLFRPKDIGEICQR
jgi:hypothetical protein